jgi:hypothetical protein
MEIIAMKYFSQAITVVDAGKDIEKDSEKSAHVVVYYTEESGKKVALFFETSV